MLAGVPRGIFRSSWVSRPAGELYFPVCLAQRPLGSVVPDAPKRLPTIDELRASMRREGTGGEVLSDSFGRFHDYLRISLTERCNLRCLYCMPEDGVDLSPKDQILSAEEVIGISKLFVKAGVRKIRLTGGEPTVRPDLLEIVEGLGALSGLEKICITSNGIVLGRKLEGLQRAGLTHVNISLDTLEEDRYTHLTRRPGLKKVLGTVTKAIDLGFDPVKINCVLMRGENDDEIGKFVQMTENQPVDIRFIEYMPFDGNRWEQQKMIPYREVMSMIEHQTGRTLVKLKDGPNETARGYRVEGYRGSVSFITSMSENFCSSCNRLRITADGNLKVCLFGHDEVSLRDALRSGASEDQLYSVIRDAVRRKRARHAGMLGIAKSRNRPMILIGG
mmetsp:Transcript_24142/g.67670  ORF Transcript_24142/g.67670 Transcript_24142/m.67670 type:complete len:390 (+) Transcript_24142:100-1269(+)